MNILLIALVLVTLVPAVLVFLERRLMNAVLCLAASAVGSALLFLYLGQTLVALLQLFVFVGGLSTYLVVAVASEKGPVKMLDGATFFFALVVIAAALALVLNGIGFGQQQQQAVNSFSASAETAFGSQYALLYASVFLLSATAVGSVLVLRRFSKMVV